jgi:DNA-binding NarL/FixJ family response regulator
MFHPLTDDGRFPSVYPFGIEEREEVFGRWYSPVWVTYRLPFLVMKKMRVLIVSPSRAVQEGLVALCQTSSDIQVIEATSNGSHDIILELDPDIALIDGQDMAYGLQYVHFLKQQYPLTRIVILVEKLDSQTIWDAARSGAVGCITKGESAGVLLSKLRSFYEQTR